jgi:hypothetical protein
MSRDWLFNIVLTVSFVSQLLKIVITMVCTAALGSMVYLTPRSWLDALVIADKKYLLALNLAEQKDFSPCYVPCCMYT